MRNDRVHPEAADQNQIKPYKKDAGYSYTLGAFPTFELMEARPEQIRKILIDPSFTDQEKLIQRCREQKLPYEFNQKLITKLSDKENCYVTGVFEKYECSLHSNRPHIVLVHPSNMGNLGTILRTAVGFGIYDIAIIQAGADLFHPKTVRSSMGALFRLNFHYYESFQDYRKEYPEHEVFTFMLNGEKTLTLRDCPKAKLFSLVFGNEATGLDASYLEVGTSIFIPQSPDVDSLNLTIAVGIGTYIFMNQE